MRSPCGNYLENYRPARLAPSSLPPILRAAEVACLLRVNRKTLYEAVQRKEVPGVIRIGRCLRFRRDALLQWLDSPQRSGGPHS